MNMKLISTKLNHLNIYSNQKLEIDFFAEKRVYSEEKETFVVCNLFNTINKLNNIAFIGRNASGKTVTLGILSDILKIYINNKSISEVKNLVNFFESRLEIENILTDGENLYKINSTIKKDELGEPYFYEETLYKTNVTTTISKERLNTTFNNIKGEKRSSLDNPFLKKEDSIFSSILNKYKISLPSVIDLGRLTNFNFLVSFSSKMPLSFVNYLDPSIEDFKMLKNEIEGTSKGSDTKYSIKFKDSDKEIITDSFNLDNYLSSGTIKGINILTNAMVVLMTGGYLLVDEIENHLNKSIVINLIDLFTSDLNQKGATLLFTTHYSEILDSISRSDSIYVLNKKEKISVSKFSMEADKKDRQDKKKSDLMLSGMVGTSPSYFAYKQLKKDLRTMLLKGGHE